MPTTNFPNGATNNTAQNALGGMLMQDPTKAHTYFNDFDSFDSGEWNTTSVGTPITALSDSDGGALSLVNAAGAGDLVFLEKEPFTYLMEVGKPTFFKAKFKINQVAQSVISMGLQYTDTTPETPTDGLFFKKDTGSTLLDFVVAKDSVATTASNIIDLVDDEYMTVAFYYDGIDKVSYYAGADDINPAFQGQVPTTNLPDDQGLTFTFGIANGEAVAKAMDIDYIFASKER